MKTKRVREHPPGYLALGSSPGMRKSVLPPELDALSKSVIAAALEVHRLLGPGFIESVYERALAIELEQRGLRFRRQSGIDVAYKGVNVGEHRLDFVIEDAIVVELKAVEALAGIHEAQLISYLKATGLKLGLLMNFNVPLLRHGVRRVVHPDVLK